MSRPVEIERKFLLRNGDWRNAVRRSVKYRQGYLSEETRCSVRVRTDGGNAWLNIKSATVGPQRQEFEYQIPLADGEQLLRTLSRKPLIEKTRHFVEFGGHTWEIDVFEGDNAGLTVAEVELRSVDEVFERPPWVGEEVTDDPRYYNTSLSRHPYREWGRE